MDDSIRGKPIAAFGWTTAKTWNAVLVLVLLAAAGLLLFNLAYWPTPWYDEGAHLQISKNLVLHGSYGLQSGEQFRLFDPLISIGPTITLPIALAFKLFGIGLAQARVVMVIYAMLALIAFALLARHVFDTPTAVVAALWLLVFPQNPVDVTASFLGLGRMALGEVPALLFVTAGTLVWFHALDRGCTRRLIVAGLLFGLAAVTKEQMLLVLPALAAVWLVDRLWHRQLKLRQVAVPVAVAIACTLAWNLVQRYAPGSSYTEQLAGVGSGLATRALAALSSPGVMVRNLGALSAAGALTWGIPGLAYGLYLSRERSLAGVKRSFLLLLAATLLAWFVVGSIGWLRYALVGAAIMSIFTAKLLVDLAGGVALRQGPRSGVQRIDARSVAVMLAVALMILLPLQAHVRGGMTQRDTTAAQFAGDLDRLVPADATVESFEAEIAFLSGHRFRQPGLETLMQTVRHVWLGEAYPPDFYKLGAASAYLVDGPLSKRTGLYAAYLDNGCCQLIQSDGDYDLYAITQPAALR